MYETPVKMVHIEVTDKCNSECAVCPRNYNGGAIHPNIKNIQLGLDYFKLLGDEFMENIIQWQFCGTRGDPMANTEIVEICEYIRSITPWAKIIIRTNGGIGGVERYKKLSEIIGSKGFLVFSVDGWEDTNHIYRKNVRWEKVRANMDAYLSGPGIMHWDFIVFKHNYHQIPLAKEFARKNNIHLELKEPFGFETGDGSVQTLPVYDRKSGNLLYEIEPETENKIPDFIHGHQPGRMGTKYYKADVKRMEHSKNQLNAKGDVESSWTHKFPPIEHYSYLKGQKFEYNCEALDKEEVFIDCDGMFIPCCFIASAQFMKEPQIMDMYSKVDKSKLFPTETWKPSDILKTEFFTKIMPDAFEGKLDDAAGSCQTCINMCSKKLGRVNLQS